MVAARLRTKLSRDARRSRAERHFMTSDINKTKFDQHPSAPNTLVANSDRKQAIHDKIALI